MQNATIPITLDAWVPALIAAPHHRDRRPPHCPRPPPRPPPGRRDARHLHRARRRGAPGRAAAAPAAEAAGPCGLEPARGLGAPKPAADPRPGQDPNLPVRGLCSSVSIPQPRGTSPRRSAFSSPGDWTQFCSGESRPHPLRPHARPGGLSPPSAQASGRMSRAVPSKFAKVLAAERQPNLPYAVGGQPSESRLRWYYHY